MAQNITYVACPNCKGRFYVETKALALDTFRCYCPFCATEFLWKEARGDQGAAKPAA